VSSKGISFKDINDSITSLVKKLNILRWKNEKFNKNSIINLYSNNGCIT
jgi:hypothetical protein